MKIKDKTSKQKLSYQDCKFWENNIIKDLIYWLIIDYSEDEIQYLCKHYCEQMEAGND